MASRSRPLSTQAPRQGGEAQPTRLRTQTVRVRARVCV